MRSSGCFTVNCLRRTRKATTTQATSKCAELSPPRLKTAHPTGSNYKIGSCSPMSALGHKRTYAVQKGMSALPPKADMCGAIRDVRFVPKADMGSAACLFPLLYIQFPLLHAYHGRPSTQHDRDEKRGVRNCHNVHSPLRALDEGNATGYSEEIGDS